MLTLILIALAGAAANLVDGGIGMGFGVTSTTMLLLAGLGPAQASAVVHTAELGTTAISGLSHARFGNVDWKTVVRLGVPGGSPPFGRYVAVEYLHRGGRAGDRTHLGRHRRQPHLAFLPTTPPWLRL